MEEGVTEITENLDTSEIRFAINEYSDLFDDFDPREISKKGLSEDFLSEARRASMVKEGDRIDFIFLVPRKIRDLKQEMKIEERLKRYFKKHSGILEMEKKKTIRQGLNLIALGIIFMFIATFLIFEYKDQNLFIGFLVVLFEPGGTFLFWSGLDDIMFGSKKLNPNLEFHKKMVNASIKFVSV